MANVTYKTPGLDKKSRKIVYTEKRGDVAFMQIGERRVKCVLQRDDKESAPALVHYASGWVIVSRDAIHNYHLMQYVNARVSLTWRHVAELVLANTIDQVGADKVLAKMDAAPVINPD
jgi:type IV secretory pathway component VirB8